MLICGVVGMDEMQDPDMASKKARNGKYNIIEVIPDGEEDTEVDFGVSGPTYDETRCCMDVGIVYIWGDVYTIFFDDIQGEENKNLSHEIDEGHTKLLYPF
jgi:hypothetical protein